MATKYFYNYLEARKFAKKKKGKILSLDRKANPDLSIHAWDYAVEFKPKKARDPILEMLGP